MITTLLIFFFVTATAFACFDFRSERPNKSQNVDSDESDSIPLLDSHEDSEEIEPILRKEKSGSQENAGRDEYSNPIISGKTGDDYEDYKEQLSGKMMLKERMKTHFKKGVRDMMAKHKVPDAFKIYLHSIAMPHAFRLNTDCHCGGLLCIVCEIVIDILLELIDDVIDLRDIFFILTEVCIHMKIESKEVCVGAIDLQAVSVLLLQSSAHH